jgi:signal transduction histidine kinase
MPAPRPSAPPRARTLLPVALFAVLAILEVGLGVSRLAEIREKGRRGLLREVELGHAALAEDLAERFEEVERHLDYLTRSAAFAPVRDGEAEIPAALADYFAAYERLEAVVLQTEAGAARRVIARDADGAPRELPAERRAAFDHAPGSDRRPFELLSADRARLHASRGTDGGRFGVALDVTAPLAALHAPSLVRSITSFLVDDEGRQLAARDGAVRRLAEVHPGAAPSLLAGETRVRVADAAFLATPVGAGNGVRLVTRIPDGAQVELQRRFRRETRVITLAMVVVVATLAAGTWYLLRTQRRGMAAEAALRELEQRRELERRLATTEHLSALGLLTAGVAHEVNNPLEGIGNYLGLLEKDDLPAAKRSEYLGRVRQGFERIRGLMRDLLGFARPGSEPGPIDLREVARHAVELVQLSKELAEVRVELRGLDAPMVVTADAGGLEQVLVNLLLNAGRSQQGRGTITITGRRARDPESGAGVIELAVEDEGKGIAPEDLGQLFEPFFTRGGGTGLGLSVSHGIVRAHGGALLAANRDPDDPAAGACFTLRLPDPHGTP